ncbi:TonB-dependent receptor [Dyella sp. BiH032]|uniref:TonB-dependent receptor n=1 Tax=Dyella sp. BiH032 TaxID=3075430 RepID=UPI0028936B15|nr:TonB-dependent receptor [Dyella sp. BiH032]WNL46328.1 TonB-dependent receptor [Dyella sp. BiH032]
MQTFRHPRYAVACRRTALAAALAMGLAGTAMAQSNASGVIFGRTAEAGSSIHIENLDTGFARDIAVDADGRYRAGSLPVGRYKVTLQKDGKTLESRDNVQVALGSGVDVSFAGAVASSAGNAQTLEGIQVVGNALPAIDVSSVDSRTVLTSEQLQKLPLARNVTAAALLAPGVVSGDSRYGNVASFGGASASENQYYINGYAVTNALTGLGFTSLPYDAIDQQQIYTGGYGAEYGRSTGGVINVVTKRGGNTWKGGVGMYVIPQYFRDSPRSIYRTNGTLYQYNGDSKFSSVQYTGYVSGPLIKDKLFLYAAGDFTSSSGHNVLPVTTPQRTNEDSKATKWLAKIDWNITDNHLLELTGLSDKNNTTKQVYAYDYNTFQATRYLGSDKTKNFDSGPGSQPGGDVYIGKYTGYITDNLTVNALYGRSKTEHVRDLSYASNPNCPWVLDNRNAPPSTIIGCGLVNGTVLGKGAQDKTHGWRLDVEYRLGSHDLRAGVDNQTLESFAGNVYEGGYRWVYRDAGPVTGRPDIVPPPGTDYVVEKRLFQTGASVKVEQEAQFIEDRWQATDRWLIYLGLRNEQFKNLNGAGDVYVKQRHQLAPRLGVTWDVFGDSSFKVYANAGRYHLAIPSNVAIRGASASTYYSEYYTYTGVAPNGEPTGLTQLGSRGYLNGEDGTTPDPRSVAAQNIKAYYQDEYILGFDKSLGNDWTFGAKATLRKLKSSIDDFCDSRPFEKYAARNNIDISNASIAGCYLFNPGQSNTFMVDVNGQGNFVPFRLTKEDFTSPEGVAFPDLKRKYYSLDLYLEHQFSNQWYGRVDYTFSRSYGNSEGQLKSDIGQLDPSVTQDWDAPEIMQFTNGPLPNDRTHQLKAYGYFQATNEWLFGANLAVASGRPKNCIGFDPVDAIQYGASYFECNFQPSPRGSKGRLPWTWTMDLNMEYRPTWAGANQPLAFTANVFNLFSKKKEVAVIEVGESSISKTTGLPVRSVNYLRPVAFQTPRYFQFGVRYDFSM